MQPVPNQIRTEQTLVLLEQIDAILERWRGFDFSNVFGAADWEQLVRNIDRGRRQFDSKLFFVVIFGPLKAGKSTLTNALAGQYVSPSGFGIETTRRPSLVVHSAESGIDQYFSTDPIVNHFLSQRHLRKATGKSDPGGDEKSTLTKVHEAFDEVEDFVRGIRDKDEGRIRTQSTNLDETSLKRILTQELPTEPLLTVIRCVGGHLLNHGVAIVDMPGLDGNRSNWRADPIHEWVINRAEFFLFVQSSVAALNNETHEFLKEVVAQSTKPPIWLVQNIFNARNWLPEEEQRREEGEQREEGRKRLTELLKEAPRAVLGLNAGLAWDGKSKKNDGWLEKSEFTKFETGLSEVLNAERSLIQERKYLEDLSRQFAKARALFCKGSQGIEEVRRNHKRQRDELKSAQGVLDAVNYQNDWESAVRGQIATMAEATVKPWLESLDIEVVKLRDRFDRKKTAKDVNGELAIVAARLGAEGDAKHFAKSPMLPQYVKLANQYCKSAENDAVAVCNQSLDTLNLANLPASVLPTVEDLPSMAQDGLKEDKLKEHPWYNPYYDSDCDGHTILAHIEEVAKIWRQQIRERRDGWVSQLSTAHFSTYCEKRRKHFRDHLQRLLDDFETNARPKEESAKTTENLIERLNEGLRNLELPLENACASMK
jgi:hypothetical protein